MCCMDMSQSRFHVTKKVFSNEHSVSVEMMDVICLLS